MPAVKAAFVAALQARPALASLTVTRGKPNPPLPDTGEQFYLLGMENGDRREMTDQPGGPRAESYEIPCVFDVLDHASQESAESRAWEIVDEIDAALDEDPQLGNARSVLFVVRGEGSAEIGKRWGARIEADLRVTARR